MGGRYHRGVQIVEPDSSAGIVGVFVEGDRFLLKASMLAVGGPHLYGECCPRGGFPTHDPRLGSNFFPWHVR